jgi:two-component system CheB/CheR fusion protein
MSKQVNHQTKMKPAELQDDSVPVVAVGASAGGMEAMIELLENLPASTGMAYVYIQHLDATYESHLSEILSRHTPMEVVEVKERTKIAADHIYVITPGLDLIMANSYISPVPRNTLPGIHLPIDQFLISLASQHKHGAIGVILSGSATDGTLGLKTLKAAGGITFAQDSTAKFNSMPMSVISEGIVDMVLSPSDIASEISQLSRNRHLLKQLLLDSNAAASEASDSVEDIYNILQIVKQVTGVDFSHYKMATMRRRMIRRMVLHRIDILEDYVKYIKKHPAEVKLLFNDLLINVTSFFRDPEALEFLKLNVLPQILNSKKSADSIRIWIPACSTGEEVYSLAIIIMETFGDKTIPIQIFASDLSENAISKARLGFYTKSDVTEIDAARLQNFFVKVEGGYRIVKTIRDMCIFAQHNIFNDPPFSRIDLISCCNLLIYLEPVLQQKMMSTFHYALNQNGFLVLGKSETAGTGAPLFTQLDKKYKIFSRRRDGSINAPFDIQARISNTEKRKRTEIKTLQVKEHKPDELEQTIDDILLKEYVPPSVLVNNNLDILQFRGSTSPYLEPSRGKASLNLLKMAKEGLAFELRNVIHKANKTGETTVKAGIEFRDDNTPHFVTIEARPVRLTEEERLFLIIFREALPPPFINADAYQKDKVVKQLQDELVLLREDLRSIVEDQETSNQELQSANEEIVSSNEELQSINEELETSKEEQESTNEELMTINQEMHTRNDQLAEAYDYAEAMFGTIRESLLVLDADLRIKTANRAFYSTFKASPEETEGKYIYDLGNGQWKIPDLKVLLDNTLKNDQVFTGFEVSHNFPQIGKKIMLLNARRVIQKIHNKELILLAIEDITEHRAAAGILQERETWFHAIADDAPAMLWVCGSDRHATYFNKTWLQFRGRTLDEELQNSWQAFVHPDDRERRDEIFNFSFEAREQYRMEYRLLNADGAYRWVLDIGKPTYDADGNFNGFMGTCIDIQDHKNGN